MKRSNENKSKQKSKQPLSFQDKTRELIQSLLGDGAGHLLDKYMSQLAYKVNFSGWSWEIIYETIKEIYFGENPEKFSEDIGIAYPVSQKYNRVVQEREENLKYKVNIHSYFNTEEGISLSQRIKENVPDVVINFDDEAQERLLNERHEKIMESLVGPKIDIDEYIKELVEKGEL